MHKKRKSINKTAVNGSLKTSTENLTNSVLQFDDIQDFSSDSSDSSSEEEPLVLKKKQKHISFRSETSQISNKEEYSQVLVSNLQEQNVEQQNVEVQNAKQQSDSDSDDWTLASSQNLSCELLDDEQTLEVQKDLVLETIQKSKDDNTIKNPINDIKNPTDITNKKPNDVKPKENLTLAQMIKECNQKIQTNSEESDSENDDLNYDSESENDDIPILNKIKRTDIDMFVVPETPKQVFKSPQTPTSIQVSEWNPSKAHKTLQYVFQHLKEYITHYTLKEFSYVNPELMQKCFNKEYNDYVKHIEQCRSKLVSQEIPVLKSTFEKSLEQIDKGQISVCVYCNSAVIPDSEFSMKLICSCFCCPKCIFSAKHLSIQKNNEFYLTCYTHNKKTFIKK